MSATYVHLPTEVEAAQWLGHYEDFPAEWRASGALILEGDALVVITGKGPAPANIGDWVLHSNWEEYWPIAEPKFLASYGKKS